MFNKKSLKEGRFFTTNGTDIWKLVAIQTVTQVEMKNCETGLVRAFPLDDKAAAEKFQPIVMPKTKAGDKPADLVKGPNHRVEVHQPVGLDAAAHVGGAQQLHGGGDELLGPPGEFLFFGGRQRRPAGGRRRRR